MGGCRSTHDQDPNWHWRSVYPKSIRHTWICPRHHHADSRSRYYNLGAYIHIMYGIIDSSLTVILSNSKSDYIVGCFKLRHPEVYGIDDAGGIMFGRIGKEVLGVVFFLCEYPAAASNTVIGLC
jgi:hypothetical protein